MAKNDSTSKTIRVALTLCIICSVIVSTAAVLLRPAQQANKDLDRKTNILAAAGIYALEHNINRLAEDHRHASELAKALAQMPSFKLHSMPVTNMVLLNLGAERFKSLQHYFVANGVKTSTQRLVIHRDISSANIDQVIELCRNFDQRD